jgi:hypothetical protein
MNLSASCSATPVSMTGHVLATLADQFVSGQATPHSIQAFAGLRFNSTGYRAS